MPVADVTGHPVIEVRPADGAFFVHVESGPWYSNAALLVSAAALLVSLHNSWSTASKEKKARARSIQDEFWLRKVVSPSAIEGLTVIVAEQLNALPDAHAPHAERVDYNENFRSDIRMAHHKLQLLRIIDAGLASAVGRRFETFEDDVTNFLFYEDLDEGERGNRLTASAVEQNSYAMLADVFELIRKHQSSV